MAAQQGHCWIIHCEAAKTREPEGDRVHSYTAADYLMRDSAHDMHLTYYLYTYISNIWILLYKMFSHTLT